MIQTMQFIYGHFVSINSIKKLYYNIFAKNKNIIFKNIHSKFYKEKCIVIDIIYYYKNDFVLLTNSVFMIEKTSNVVVDE
jgi:hypothetical protein